MRHRWREKEANKDRERERDRVPICLHTVVQIWSVWPNQPLRPLSWLDMIKTGIFSSDTHHVVFVDANSEGRKQAQRGSCSRMERGKKMEIVQYGSGLLA